MNKIISAFIEKEIDEQIEKLCKDQNRSKSYIVRELIIKGLESEK